MMAGTGADHTAGRLPALFLQRLQTLIRSASLNRLYSREHRSAEARRRQRRSPWGIRPISGSTAGRCATPPKAAAAAGDTPRLPEPVTPPEQQFGHLYCCRRAIWAEGLAWPVLVAEGLQAPSHAGLEQRAALSWCYWGRPSAHLKHPIVWPAP